ncbi:MAG TPA: hypothetical protein DD379_16565 [Cyanobacteria bacterium UBA11162]|nr:hypothetical protein [Cyanobacteria bacterium UBA11162]
MRSQWECFLQNLGEWQGSFTTFSPQGEQLQDIPSVLTLQGLDNNRKVRLHLRYLPPEYAGNERVLDYTYVGGNLMFFENGAFSQGSIQWAPFTQCGAELALIESDRRLRLAQVFNKDSQLSQLTLIREKLAGTNTPERPPLTLEQLLGEWEGEATTLYRNGQEPQTYPTQLIIERQDSNRLLQRLTYGTGASTHTIASTAKINGSILQFDEGALPIQVMLLPDGASSNCPLVVKPGHVFVLEVGWLVEPDQRQRLIRTYNERGAWDSLTLVKEQRVKVGN